MAENINIDLIINGAKAAKTLKEQKEALKQINEALTEVKYGSGAFELLTDEAKNLTNQIDTLAVSFEDLYGETKPLQTQLGELEDILQRMSLEGKNNTEEFKKFQDQAVKLKKTIQEVDETIDSYAQKGAKLKGFVNIGQSIAGAFALASSATQLLGIESKSLEQSLNTFMITMEIINGLEAINTSLKEKNVIVTAIQNGMKKVGIVLAGEAAVAAAAEAAANGTATTAQIALNSALNANPIMLIITAVIALTGAYALLGDSTEEAALESENFTNKMQKSIKFVENLGNQIRNLREQTVASNNAIINNAKLASDLANQSIQEEISLLNTKTTKTEQDYARIAELTKEQHDNNIKYLEIEAAKSKDNAIVNKIQISSDIANTQFKIEKNKKLYQDYQDSYKKMVFEGEKEEALKYKEKMTAKADENIELRNTILKLKADEITAQNEVDKADSNSLYKRREEENKYTLFLQAEEQRRLESAKKLAEDKRKLDYDRIQDSISRTESANRRTEELETELIDNQEQREKSLSDIKYGQIKEDLINKATQREIAALDQKFLKLELTESEYMKNRESIINNGLNNLNEAEKRQMVTEEKMYNNQMLFIIDNYDQKNKLAEAYANKLIAETERVELNTKKQAEIADANKIENVEQREAKIKEINDKYRVSEENIRKKLFNAEKTLLDLRFLFDMRSTKTTAEEKKKIVAQYNLDIANLEADNQKKKEENNSKELSDTQQLLEKKKKAQEQFNASMISAAASAVTIMTNLYSGMIASQVSASQTNLNEQLNAIDKEQLAWEESKTKRTNAEQAELDKKAEFENRRKELQAKQAKEERALKQKEFNMNKGIQLAQITINTAVAITKALAELGPVAGAIAGFGIGAAGALQAGVVLSQQPTFARGGILDGPSHAQGGIQTGFGELEGGEYVVNKKNTQLFLPVLDALNSYGGNGNPVLSQTKSMFQTGGNLPQTPSNITTNNIVDTSNIEAILQQYLSQPIETYMKVSTITNTQNRMNKIQNKNRF